MRCVGRYVERIQHIFRGIKYLMFGKVRRTGMFLYLICVNQQHVNGVGVIKRNVMGLSSVVLIEVIHGDDG